MSLEHGSPHITVESRNGRTLNSVHPPISTWKEFWGPCTHFNFIVA